MSDSPRLQDYARWRDHDSVQVYSLTTDELHLIIGELLDARTAIEERAGRVSESWYEVGWDDGFAAHAELTQDAAKKKASDAREKGLKR